MHSNVRPESIFSLYLSILVSFSAKKGAASKVGTYKTLYLWYGNRRKIFGIYMSFVQASSKLE